jgi:aconitate hydratase
MFRKQYSTVSDGDQNWQHLKFPSGNTYGWEPDSTYIRKAPYFDGMTATPAGRRHPRRALPRRARRLRHHRPHLPRRLHQEERPRRQVPHRPRRRPADFNSYGSRRGNHEVMVRGTFANVRLRNKLAPGTEGGVTRLLPEGTEMSIYDASRGSTPSAASPLCILAGKEYGSGSSRDWAAKGPRLLGIKFVIAESYERIHRSNLVGMGILPFQFLPGQSAESLGLTGEEIFSIGDHPGQLKAMLDSKFANGRILPSSPKTTRQDHRVLRHPPHRHPAGDPLLPARRHPAIRPPPTRRQIRPAALSAAISASVNTRDRIRNRTPSLLSSENIPPRPGTTSRISCVCFQYSNCGLLM